jgi:hypothetical protein
MASGDKAIIDALRDENEFLRHRNEMLKGIRTENPTLRDQFAMAALTGLLAAELEYDNPADHMAKQAYIAADAMLKAREENK